MHSFLQIKKSWRMTVALFALVLACLAAWGPRLFAQDEIGRVVFIKENRLYIDWNRSSGIKKGKLVFVLSGRETLGTATVGWVMDDLTMAEMATGFSRLEGVSKEALSVQPEVEKQIIRAASFAVGMANPLETIWNKKVPTPDNWALLSCLYEGLITETEEGRFRPVLCDSFRFGERSVTFHVKPKLAFHSGKRLTAFEIKKVLEEQFVQRTPEAVRFASFLAPKATLPKRFPPLTSPVEARDTATLVIYLKSYTPVFMSYLASPLGWIKDFSDTLSRFPAGSGPYRVETIRPNAIRLLRSRGYHGALPQADTLNFRWFAQREDAEIAFLRGEISMAWFRAGELSQNLRFDPNGTGRELCRVPANKKAIAFLMRPTTPDSSRMLASGAVSATEEIGSELFRGDWVSEGAPSADPDSFKLNFQIDPQLDSTGLVSAFLSGSRGDLPLLEMQLAQVETYSPAREARLAALLGKFKDYTGSRQVDSLSTELARVLFLPAREKEPVLNGIEKFLTNRFALVYLYRPAMVLVARPELAGFACGQVPYYPAIFKKAKS